LQAVLAERPFHPNPVRPVLRGGPIIAETAPRVLRVLLVHVIQIDVLPTVATAHDVVHGSGVLNTHLTRHDATMPGTATSHQDKGRSGWRLDPFLAFVSYDDGDFVTQNPRVQAGLTAEGFKWAWHSQVARNWHPVTMLSHMLDCQFFKLDAGKHHLTRAALSTSGGAKSKFLSVCRAKMQGWQTKTRSRGGRDGLAPGSVKTNVQRNQFNVNGPGWHQPPPASMPFSL
jgi:hypothetical protein